MKNQKQHFRSMTAFAWFKANRKGRWYKWSQKIKAVKFPYRKYTEDLEMNLLPEGMRKRLPELCTLDFIREGKNVDYTIVQKDRIYIVCGKNNPFLSGKKKRFINGKNVYVFEKSEIENLPFYSSAGWDSAARHPSAAHLPPAYAPRPAGDTGEKWGSCRPAGS